MRTAIATIFAFLVINTNAQPTINVDDTSKFTNSVIHLNASNGVPFVMAKYARIVDGSIFIPEKLSPAQIFMKGNAKAFNNVSARLNIIDNQLNYYDDIKGMELVASSDISEVRFKDAITGNVRIFTKSIPDCPDASQGWHEILETGKLNLYRHIVKSIAESKPYGSATTEQSVITNFNYWIKTGNACRPVKKISELTDILTQYDPAFKGKLPQRKLSDKKQEDWLEVVRAFNSSH